jgi:hypothetical protein
LDGVLDADPPRGIRFLPALEFDETFHHVLVAARFAEQIIEEGFLAQGAFEQLVSGMRLAENAPDGARQRSSFGSYRLIPQLGQRVNSM